MSDLETDQQLGGGLKQLRAALPRLSTTASCITRCRPMFSLLLQTKRPCSRTELCHAGAAMMPASRTPSVIQIQIAALWFTASDDYRLQTACCVRHQCAAACFGLDMWQQKRSRRIHNTQSEGLYVDNWPCLASAQNQMSHRRFGICSLGCSIPAGVSALHIPQ